MNLLQFIELVTQGASAEEIAISHAPNMATEDIGVYMENEASLTSELAFFDSERVQSTIFITVDGKQYEAFFLASELADLIPEYTHFSGAAATALTIAEAILHYHEYDA